MKTKQTLMLCLVFFITHLASAQWVKQNTPKSEAPLYYLHASDINTLWSFTRVPVQDPANPKKVELIRTGDGGRTYKKTTLFPVSGDVFLHVEPMDGKNAHMIYATNQGEFGLKRTTDSGATWQNLGWQPTNFPDVVYFWDLNNGIVASDPDSLGMVVMYTTDGGNTFSRVPQTNLPYINAAEEFGLINEFQVIGNTVFMAIYNFVTGEERYWRSLDRGRNWTSGAGYSNNTIFTTRIAFADNNNGMLLRGISNTTERPLYTTDGGNTWKEAEGNMPSYVDWSIDNVPGTDNFMALFQDTTRRMLYSALTNDFGKTWNSRKDLVPYILDSSFVQFGAPPMVFSYLNIISNSAAWGKFSLFDIYRYDSPTTIVPEKPDLELELKADNDGLPLYGSVKYTLTVRNRGISSATGIRINWLPPYKRTNNGAGAYAYQASYSDKGRYDGWNGVWTLDHIEASGTATATFHLFVVNNTQNVTQTAQVVACNESDIDSSPNNMGASAKEDDEVSFVARAINSTAEMPNAAYKRQANDFTVSPNPAKDKINVSINSEIDAQWTIRVMNSIGQTVFSRQGQNVRTVDIDARRFENGLYFVEYQSNGERKVGEIMIEH